MHVCKKYVFVYVYCFCYDTYLSTYMLEDQVAEERAPDLIEEEDIRLDEIIEEHWRDFSEEGEDNKKIHALRWEV